MAHIRTIDEAAADGELAAVYTRIRSASGGVANILRAESLAPPALGAHYTLYRELLFGASPLTRRQRELVAVVVSATNGCHY